MHSSSSSYTTAVLSRKTLSEKYSWHFFFEWFSVNIAFLFIAIELKTPSNSMNLYGVTFSLSKYIGYVYNSFKLKFVEVRLLFSCHSQLWKGNKLNSPRKK